MGLAERRGSERFTNEDYPGWKSRIDEAAGFEVPIDVTWDELAVPDYADRYAEYFPQVYFQPLVDALSAIAPDDMSKEALREGLSKIVEDHCQELRRVLQPVGDLLRRRSADVRPQVGHQHPPRRGAHEGSPDRP